MSFVLLFVIHVPTILLSVWNSNVESTWMTNLEKLYVGAYTAWKLIPRVLLVIWRWLPLVPLSILSYIIFLTLGQQRRREAKLLKLNLIRNVIKKLMVSGPFDLCDIISWKFWRATVFWFFSPSKLAGIYRYYCLIS